MQEPSTILQFAERAPAAPVRPIEADAACDEARAFYGAAEARFQTLLNVFKMFGHQPEYGRVFTDTILAILKDGVLSWPTKELLILKTTYENRCHYCVVQHERVAEALGIPAAKVADLAGVQYRRSPHFTDAERSLLDFCGAIVADANSVPSGIWTALRRQWSEAQIVDAAFVVAMYTAVSRFVDALGVPLEEEPEEGVAQLAAAG